MSFTATTLLTVKNLDEERRVIRGIASTPTPDRTGDIVEPMGAKFKTPLPLLLYHQNTKPVGTVDFAKPTKDGIPFTASIPIVTEPGIVQDRVNEAWHSLKYKLISAVSIGFKPMEDGVEILKSGGLHFKAWEWLELSLVPVPAQSEAVIQSFKSMDANRIHQALGTKPEDDAAERAALITNIKSADQAALAALGTPAPLQPTARSNPPGDSGIPNSRKGNTKMQTYKDHIAALEATRAAKSARMTAIADDAAAKSVSIDSDQAVSEEFDNTDREIAAIDKDLVRYRKLDAMNVEKAVPVVINRNDAPLVNSGILSVKSNLAPGQKFARYALALKRAHGNLNDAMSIVANNKTWMDTSPELLTVMKTAVAAGDTTTSGWASQLVYAENLANEFIEYLRPMTIIGRIPGFRNVPFNVRMASQTGGSTGYWVGQALPIPVSKLAFGSTSLGITKAAGIVVLDDELVRSSSPSAELLVRDDLAREMAKTSDAAFIDPNNGGVTNVKPASVLYGVTPVTPTGTNAAALFADIKSVQATMIAADVDISGAVWIMTPAMAQSIGMMLTSLGQPQFAGINKSGGTFFGDQVIVSNAASISGSPQYGSMIVYLNPRDIFLADDGQTTIEISKEASLEMLDNPTNSGAGSTVATTMVSMFQTHSEAIKGVRYINWAKRRTTAAAFIQASLYA